MLYAHTPREQANRYMARAARWVDRHFAGRLAEGILNPGLSVDDQRLVDPSVGGSSTWAAHRNHLRLAR